MGRAWVFGDNISTDYIIPGRFNITTDPKELRKHLFKYARPEFVDQFKTGDVIISGKNFGCGSSREHAAIALKECNIPLIANSYGWIFRRNCVNLGVLPLETEEKLEINDGDEVELDLTNLKLIDVTTQKSYKLKPMPQFVLDIYRAGGLVEYLNKAKKYRV
jgi:3-isopropylmalate/(R)-2-methylmalate dehydratase small subunit